MKIGVISDSHDNMPMIRKAVGFFNGREDITLVVHAGDFVAPFALEALLELRVPMLAVFGNNDGERAGLARLMPGLAGTSLTSEIGERRICVVHSIDDVPGDDGIDVIIYGHDHRSNIEPGPPLKVNPGECCGYLTGRPTVAVIDLAEMTAEIIELT